MDLKGLEVLFFNFFQPRHFQAQALLHNDELRSHTDKQAQGQHLLALHELQQRMRADHGIELPRVLVHVIVPAARASSGCIQIPAQAHARGKHRATTASLPVPFLDVFAAGSFQPRLARLRTAVEQAAAAARAAAACLLRGTTFWKIFSASSEKSWRSLLTHREMAR